MTILEPNTFILFKKEITTKDGKKTIIWAGPANFNGVDFEISGFRGTSKDGAKEYLKGRCKEPWQKPSESSSTPF